MMETGWERDFCMGTEMELTASAATFAGETPTYMYNIPTADSLTVDDLLNFTNHDIFSSSSSSSSSVPTDDVNQPPSNQEFSFSASAVNSNVPFSDDIYVPSEEAAELEWLSKFVEDSFSDTPYHYSFAEKTENSNFAAAEILTSSSSSSSSSSDVPKIKGSAIGRKNGDGSSRRCTHCSSEKTPQWRTGPLGPKTLCNACGVRFKSGRLVPEYRPAASPTFVLAQHSNSHRKVMELRRQKEFLILRSGGDGGFSPEMIYEEC